MQPQERAFGIWTEHGDHRGVMGWVIGPLGIDKRRSYQYHGYVITHLQSGMCIPGVIPRRDHALRLARLMAKDKVWATAGVAFGECPNAEWIRAAKSSYERAYETVFGVAPKASDIDRLGRRNRRG